MKKKLATEIVLYVLKECESRDILDRDAYDNLFGCKSFDEVVEGVDEILCKKAENQSV